MKDTAFPFIYKITQAHHNNFCCSFFFFYSKDLMSKGCLQSSVFRDATSHTYTQTHLLQQMEVTC